MLDGEIQSLVAEKGFGFIKPAAGGADVFFHSSVVDAPFASLAKGQPVKYDLDSQAEKPRAKVVRTGGASATASTTRANARSSPLAGRSREQRTADRRTADRPTADRPTADRPTADRPTADRPTADRSTRDRRATDRRATDGRATDRPEFEYGFVTKLHRKKFRGFISSVKHGPEFVFAAQSVTGEKRFSQLEIGDYVQFLVGEPDSDEPKQPVARAIQVVERQVKVLDEKRLGRHPKARKKKPTWR